ncbi:MAG: AsmA family protein [Gammaproteobacteria bacterium]
MRNYFKIPLYIFLGFVITFLTTIGIVPFIFDPNDYKDEITKAVRKQTNRNLEIEGDLKLQLLPKLAVLTGRISMDNPRGFSRQTFAEFESGFFRIRLLPLFSKQIEIKKIVLNGLKVDLIRAKDGRANWKRFRGPSSDPGNRRIPIQYQNVQPARMVAVDSPLALLLAAKIDIFGAELRYEDEISGIDIAVHNLDFILDRFGFDRGIDFKINGDLVSSEPRLSETAAISGRLAINENLDQFKIENFRWDSALESEFLPDEFRRAILTATAEINLAEHTFSASDLHLSTGPTTIGANFSATKIFENPALEGQVSMDKVDPVRLFKLADIDYTPQDPDALRTLNGTFTIRLNESRALFNNIALVLDGNPIKGVASISGFKTPAIKFNFSSDQLDADRYLPESGAPPLPTKPEPPPGISVVEQNLPVNSDSAKASEIQQNSVQGILNLGSLRFRGMIAEGVQIAFNLSNGVLRSNQRFKKFYGGSLKGSLEFNNREQRPVISLNQILSDIQVGPLLQAFQGKKPVEGTLQATIRLIGHGTRMQDFKASLNGDISASVTDGLIRGINLENAVRDANSLVAEIGITSESAADLTRFSQLTYQATVEDGVLRGTLLEAKSPYFDFSGNGKIDLTSEAVDYRVDAVVNEPPEGIAGIKVKKLKGLRIPIRVGGTLSSLSFEPEVQGALQDPRIRAAAQKLEKKLDEKLGSGTARRFLDKLF